MVVIYGGLTVAIHGGIHGGHIRWSYMVAYMVVIYGGHTWWPYMVVIYGGHMWWSYMVAIYGGHIWWPYMVAIYGGHNRLRYTGCVADFF